jgi:nucleoside-diphosphate-sugar epimerase
MISKSKRILITWWAGFVWSNLVRKLVDLWFSDLYLILREESDTWRINDILDKLHINYGSLNDSLFVDKCIESIRPDIIYHLAACWTSWNIDIMNEILSNNVIWTINLVSACKNVWFEYFINTWTNFEYWEKKEPFSESDLLEPNNEYAIGKAITSLYCSYIWRNYKLPIYTYRLFCVYWPYENPTRLIPSLMLSYINNVPPKLSKPDSVRDFVYVGDVVNYYINVDSIEWDFWWVYNIWSWEQYSIGDLVSYVKKIASSKIEPVYGSIPTKWKELWMYKSNTKKLNETFDVKQKSIYEWLKESYLWFKNKKYLYE